MKLKNKKKAFASTIFAGLALLIITLSAAAVLSMQESEVNSKKLFQAKQTSWLYSDAQSVLENALYDAETDSAYAGYGCTTGVNVCNALTQTRNASAYMQNALANLSVSTRNAALEIKDVTVTCVQQATCSGGGAPVPQGTEQPAPIPAPTGEPQAAAVTYGCQNFTVTTTFILKTNSSNSVKIQNVTYQNQLDIFRKTYSIASGNPTEFGIAVSKNSLKILDLRGSCSPAFLIAPATAPQATPTPAAPEIFATPSPIPLGSPQAGVPTATQPAAVQATPIPSLFASATPSSLTPSIQAPTTQPTQAAGSQPLMLLTLMIAVLLLAAFYFNKKQRPEPKSFSYVARQRKRL